MSHFYPATPNTSTSDVENAQEHFFTTAEFWFVYNICSFVWWRCFFSLQGRFILSNCWVQFWPPSIKKKSTSLPSFETGENPLLDDDSKSTSTTRTSGHESWKKLLLSMIHGASGIKCVKAMIDKTKATSVNETLAFIACNHCELTRTHFLAAWIQANC